MPMHYAIRLVAGVFVLLSLALGYWVNPLWFLFTAFVGGEPDPVGLHSLVSDGDDSGAARAGPA